MASDQSPRPFDLCPHCVRIEHRQNTRTKRRPWHRNRGRLVALRLCSWIRDSISTCRNFHRHVPAPAEIRGTFWPSATSWLRRSSSICRPGNGNRVSGRCRDLDADEPYLVAKPDTLIKMLFPGSAQAPSQNISGFLVRFLGLL